MKAAATKRFVLDASVAVAWCFSDETSRATEDLLDALTNGAEGRVPGIWPFEVANSLLVGEKRKRITSAQVTSSLQRISALPISLDPVHTDRLFEGVLLLARAEQLAEYDAAYLELALRENLPLATLDTRLRTAARNLGVELVKM